MNYEREDVLTSLKIGSVLNLTSLLTTHIVTAIRAACLVRGGTVLSVT